MALTVKSRRAEELARELAAFTGEPVAEAVTIAIEERIARFRQPAALPPGERRAALRAIRERVSRLPICVAGSDDELAGYDR